MILSGRHTSGLPRCSVARWALCLLIPLTVVAGVVPVSAFAAPVDNTLPEVTGSAKVGGELQCDSGSWSGGVSKFEFTWIRDGQEIKDPHPEEYLLPNHEVRKEDEGHQLWCIVTAYEGKEMTSKESSNSVRIPGGVKVPPVNETPPEVSGSGEVGKELKCSPGTWKGSPPPTLSYRWLRDEQEIKEQTASSYTVTPEDVGHTLSCKVIAVNEVGEAFAISNGIYFKGLKPEGPIPVVAGVGKVGEPLTCLHEGWTGVPEPTFSYQWLLKGEAIPGATGQTLLVLASYEGESVACSLTAENVEGKATAESKEFEITSKPPENTALPEISGEAKEKAELTCSTGTWTGSPTEFKYSWYRELKENEELELSSHTNKYTVVAADVGYALHCVVTAKNGGGEPTARSKAFVIPAKGGEAPVSTSKPVISGKFAGGEILSCSEGKWHGTEPVTYEYQWVRNAKEAGEVSIQGATKSTYTVQGADEGQTLTCEVTAKNKYGSGSEFSEPASISGHAPKLGAEGPSILGQPREGETLTCLGGEWTGAPPPEFSYRWLRDGAEVSGVSGYVYKVQSIDLGRTLVCVVTATNKEGKSEAETAGIDIPSGPPEPLPPGPKITGTPQVNENLVCEEGRWNGALLEPSFEWLLNGVPIAGATQKDLRVLTIYRGQLLVCRVTEKNKQGEASADSAAVRVPAIPPKDVVPPTIAGASFLGATLTCEHGLWEGAPPPSFSYQWYRDSTPITGATGSTYIIEPADQGNLLSCVVTAINPENRVELESANVVAVLGPKSESGGGQTATIVTTTTQHVITLVRDAFISQLPKTFAGLRLSSVRKKAGVSIDFTSPRAGKLEILWYVTVKAAHHKTRRIVLARGVRVYSQPSRTAIHIALTKEGKRMLKGVKRMKMNAEVTFSVSGGPTITWADPFTLH